MRKNLENQPSLLDLLEPERPATPVSSTRPPAPLLAPPAARESAIPASYRDRLIEQILRDLETLRMGANYWLPSREFYEERVAAYRETVNALPR